MTSRASFNDRAVRGKELSEAPAVEMDKIETIDGFKDDLH